MPTVLADARIGKPVSSRIGQLQCVIQLAVGQQSSIGGNRRATKLEHKSPVEVKSQRLIVQFTHSPPSPPRLARDKMLNFITKLGQMRSKTRLHSGNAD